MVRIFFVNFQSQELCVRAGIPRLFPKTYSVYVTLVLGGIEWYCMEDAYATQKKVTNIS